MTGTHNAYPVSGVPYAPIGSRWWLEFGGYDGTGEPWYRFEGWPLGQSLIVKVENDGGVAGDDENDCSFTYTLTDHDGNELATEVVPERPRYPLTTYIAAPTDSYGLALYRIGEGGAIGALVLLTAFEEIEDTGDCVEEA